MSTLSRRSVLALALLGAEGLLASCGGSGSDEAPQAQPPATGVTDTNTGGGGTATSGGGTTGGGATGGGTTTPVSTADPWPLAADLVVLADGVTSIDLNLFLPAGVARGGRFGLAGTSSPLPAGVVLSTNGLMQANTTTALASFTNIVFTYEVA